MIQVYKIEFKISTRSHELVGFDIKTLTVLILKRRVFNVVYNQFPRDEGINSIVGA